MRRASSFAIRLSFVTKDTESNPTAQTHKYQMSTRTYSGSYRKRPKRSTAKSKVHVCNPKFSSCLVLAAACVSSSSHEKSASSITRAAQQQSVSDRVRAAAPTCVCCDVLTSSDTTRDIVRLARCEREGRYCPRDRACWPRQEHTNNPSIQTPTTMTSKRQHKKKHPPLSPFGYAAAAAVASRVPAQYVGGAQTPALSHPTRSA